MTAVPWRVGLSAQEITAECSCGDTLAVPNKGLGRAAVAAWKTRHQDCTPHQPHDAARADTEGDRA